MGTFLLIVGIATIVSIPLSILVEEKKRVKTLKEIEEKRKTEEEENLVYIESFIASKNLLFNNYGIPTKEISIKGHNELDSMKNHVFIFDTHHIIVIKGIEIPYSLILGFNLTDNATSKTYSSGTIKTATSTGDIIKRGIVGGAIGGAIGASIGASTSNRNSQTFTKSTSITSHDYIISIQIDDIVRPLIEISVKNNASIAQEIIATLKVIIEKNKQ